MKNILIKISLVCIILTVILALLGSSAYANRMLGPAFDVSGIGSGIPDVAYSSVDSIYLVVWENNGIWGHFIDDDGDMVPGSTDFRISDDKVGDGTIIKAALGLFPSVTYNATDNEFLVTWDDQGAGLGRSGANQIYGQRIKSGTGQRLGRGNNLSPVTDFQITTQGSCWRSSSAWSSASNKYYVVSFNGSGVHGQLLDNKAELLSNITIMAGLYPSVCYGLDGDQFLVASDGTGVGVRGVRIRADGTIIDATPFLVTAHPGDRPNTAYDSTLKRWCVQHSYFVPPVPPGQWASPSDQYGQFVSTNPTGNPLIGGQFPIANTTNFEGETNFGTDICFLPSEGLYISSFQFVREGDVTDMAGQLVDESGSKQGPRLTFGLGEGQFFRNAADTNRKRFITVWNAPGHVKGRIYAIEETGPVSNFTVTGDGGQNILRWTNPTDTDFTDVMIRCSTSGYPATINDGILVANKAGEPALADSFVHSNLANGITYYYSIFTHNVYNEYSDKLTASATPNKATILSSNFTSSSSGWTYTNWGNNSNSAYWGTIGWDGIVGNPNGAGIRCVGYGTTDDDRRDLREGGETKRVVSTECFTNVRLSYDLRVSTLGNAFSGIGTYSGNVYHNDVQDQLLIYYSTTGISGPWIEADWLVHNDLLKYTSYGRRFVDLSAISGASDNASFALKFVWQFNTEASKGDIGDLDNVKVTGTILGKNSYCSSVRSLANDTPVSFEGKVLYYKSGSVGYIEEDNRTSGIRIEGTSLSSASVNKLVSVAGKMQTKTNGERYIALDAVTPFGDGSVRALGVNNGAVKSAGMDGLLVTVWGTVKAGSVTTNSFIITDGSDDEGIKVITIGLPGVSPDTYVTVTGAAGRENGNRVIYRK